tara:strand:+ start:159 stop:506 length:348 start_codon:yes stop_codon:yes gene_type:complete
MYDGIDPPDSFDSETNWPHCADIIGDIRDQSDCGCCWAFGAASAASDRMCIGTNGTLKVPLSAQDTCFCAEENGCNGGTLYTPVRFDLFLDPNILLSRTNFLLFVIFFYCLLDNT